MPKPIDLSLERLKRMPLDPDEVWQIGAVRFPSWLHEEGREPIRPWVTLIRSASAGLVGMSELDREDQMLVRSLQAIARLSTQRGIERRPRRVQVNDAGLLEILQPVLAEAGIDTELVERLDHLEPVIADLRKEAGGPWNVSSYLEGDGVDVRRVRAFAEAAADFYRAQPWRHLCDLDLIEVESRVPDPRLRYFVVLGNAGVVRGLGFHPSIEDHRRLSEAGGGRRSIAMASRWILSFDPIHEIPVADSELWEEHALPLAGAQAYPLLYLRIGMRAMVRGDDSVLSFAEGILRALAASTEDDFDRGRWTRDVTTSEGSERVALAIPSMLEPTTGPAGMRVRAGDPGLPDRRIFERPLAGARRMMEEGELEPALDLTHAVATQVGEAILSPASTPAERARECFYQALESSGRKRIKLAREALRIWPDCADAWVLLAEEASELDAKIELYDRGIHAGERALGPETFNQEAGHFWGLLETRPYMRAVAGYAQALWDACRRDEALERWQDLLRLNPDDNQGIRWQLVPRLLEVGQDDAAARVLASYEEDASPHLSFSRALLEFRRGGGTAASPFLERAARTNAHVIKHLLGNAGPVDLSDSYYAVGSEEEAALVAVALGPAWKRTPEAVDWLREFRRSAKKAREKKRRQRR